MHVVCKASSAIAVLYLACGLPNTLRMLGTSGLPKYAAIAYLICFGLSLLGAFSLFTKHQRLARWLLLWAIGLPSLVYATHEFTIAFPVDFHAPITVGGSYSSGRFSKFGVDLISGMLFLVLWVTTQKLVAATSEEVTSQESDGKSSEIGQAVSTDNTNPMHTSWLPTIGMIVGLFIIYLLSYAPFVRFQGMYTVASAKGRRPAFGARPFYRPAYYLSNRSWLSAPLLQWAAVWGVRRDIQKSRGYYDRWRKKFISHPP